MCSLSVSTCLSISLSSSLCVYIAHTRVHMHVEASGQPHVGIFWSGPLFDLLKEIFESFKSKLGKGARDHVPPTPTPRAFPFSKHQSLSFPGDHEWKIVTLETFHLRKFGKGFIGQSEPVLTQGTWLTPQCLYQCQSIAVAAQGGCIMESPFS